MMNEIYLCSNKCRLCLCNEKFQIPIFGEAAQEMQIYLKIRTCLPVQVSQDDELPKTICYKCVSALEQSYNLWKVSSESEAVLRNLSPKAKQDLPEDNTQYKSFCSSPYSKSSQTNNRKLLLPTGVSIIVESDSEEEEMLQLRAPRTLSALRGTTNDQTCTKWRWDSDTAVMMDTSPDFLESLSEPSTGMGDTSPDFLESLSEPSAGIRCRDRFGSDQCENVTTNPSSDIWQSVVKPARNISDSVQIQTMAQGKEKSPAHNRWRSINLFGMSANTWRDFYRSGAMFRSCEPSDRTSYHITERDVPLGQATTAPPTDSRSCGDMLQAMNERNCKTMSQCSDTPSALLNFLHTQKPHVYHDNAPQQGPK